MKRKIDEIEEQEAASVKVSKVEDDEDSEEDEGRIEGEEKWNGKECQCGKEKFNYENPEVCSDCNSLLCFSCKVSCSSDECNVKMCNGCAPPDCEECYKSFCSNHMEIDGFICVECEDNHERKAEEEKRKKLKEKKIKFEINKYINKCHCGKHGFETKEEEDQFNYCIDCSKIVCEECGIDCSKGLCNDVVCNDCKIKCFNESCAVVSCLACIDQCVGCKNKFCRECKTHKFLCFKCEQDPNNHIQEENKNKE